MMQKQHNMNSKSTTSHFLIALAMIVALAWGCKPEPTSPIGEPFDNYEGMLGQWELTQFIQLDEQSPLFESRNLSQFYLGENVNPMTVSFHADGLYSVTIEKGRNYFGSEGTWDLDDREHPSFILFYPADDAGEILDTLSYKLGSVVRPHDTVLDVELTRSCDDINLVTYTFRFARIQ